MEECKHMGDCRCLCIACKNVRKAFEVADKVTVEEVEETFKEARRKLNMKEANENANK